jgi:hypothetical protein
MLSIHFVAAARCKSSEAGRDRLAKEQEQSETETKPE